MKTIRFSSNNANEKAFVAEVRKNVNQYFKENGISTKGNALMWIKAVMMIGLYLAPFIVLLTTHQNPIVSVFLVIMMGFGEAGVGMSVMHDAAHGAFSRHKWINNMFASTMFLLGSNAFNWKVQHNILHHTFTNIYGYDLDIETKAALRLCEHAPLKRFHRYQFIYAYFFYGFMTLAKLISDISQLRDFNLEGITREQGRKPETEIAKLVITKIVYLAVIFGLTYWLTDYAWWQILIGFAIMHFTAGMIMSTVFQMAHVVEGASQPLPDENGMIWHEWAVHQLQTTSDFARSSHFLNWYVGGLNFQIEHHLFPNICHIHYRKIAPIVQKTAEQYGVTYNLKKSFLLAFVSHARRLRELGTLAHPVENLTRLPLS